MEQTSLCITCFTAGPSPLQYQFELITLHQSFGSFQFLLDTRPNFSFSLPTISSAELWGPGTLIYLIPKHIFTPSSAFACSSRSLITLQIPFPSRLWSKSLPVGTLRWFLLPERPFPSSPTCSNTSLHSLVEVLLPPQAPCRASSPCTPPSSLYST